MCTLFAASIPAIVANLLMHHYTRTGELDDPLLLSTPCEILLHYLASDPCWFPWMRVRHVSSPYFMHNPLDSLVFLFPRSHYPVSFLLPSGQPFLHRILYMFLPWAVFLCPQMWANLCPCVMANLMVNIIGSGLWEGP